LISDLPNVFRTILKKYNLSPGDFPDISLFQNKLKEVKFSEFSALKQKELENLDYVLNAEIPKLMEALPSEKDSPETLKAKMGTGNQGQQPTVPVPTKASKFGKKDEYTANPFGFAEDDEDHYWALQDSADRLLSSFEALGPEGGFLSPQIARDVLVKTGLSKEQLRAIWNLSDIDRDGYLDHHEYVVAMFLCDAVTQKGRPLPAELPASCIPPDKRDIVKARKAGGGGF